MPGLEGLRLAKAMAVSSTKILAAPEENATASGNKSIWWVNKVRRRLKREGDII